MNKQRAAELYELADRLSKLDVSTLSEQQLAERNAMVARLKEEVQGVSEAPQQVDSLVTDALKLMQGPELKDAVQALKTVLGDRELSSRRGHYNFYIRQILDMYGQKQGVAEADYSPMAKDSMKADKIRSLKNLIAIAKEQGRGVRAQELELELKKLESVSEAKKPSPKLTPVEMKKTDQVSEEINTEAYERLQKVFAFKNYES